MKGKAADYVDILGKDDKVANMQNEDDGLEEEKVMPPIRPDIHLLMVGEPGLGKS